MRDLYKWSSVSWSAPRKCVLGLAAGLELLCIYLLSVLCVGWITVCGQRRQQTSPNDPPHHGALLALTDLAGVPVRAEPHRTLNSCKGVIRCSDLKGLTKNKIVYTAGQLRGTNSIDKLITFDDGYRVLKDLCGFPPYCEKAKRDLYAMIRQLGPAQLFLTLSAAETRWVHHLKILSEVVDRKKEPISA